MERIIAAIITGSLGILAGILVGCKNEIIELLSRTKRRIDGVWNGKAKDMESLNIPMF